MPTPALTDSGQVTPTAPVPVVDRAERDRLHLEAAAGLFDTLLDIEKQGSTPKPTTPPQPKPEGEVPPVSPAPDPDELDPALLDVEQPPEPEPGPSPTGDVPPEPPTTYKVKVAGKEEDVTLDELLNGYSRTKDYTQKTMEVAEQRKLLEAEQVKTRESLSQYGELLQQAEQMLTDLAPKEPDWNALRTSASADEYQRIWTDWQRLVVTRKELAHERSQVEQKQVEAYHAARVATVDAETKQLIAVRPELADVPKLRDFVTRAFAYAKEQGYTPQQLAQIDDHRILLMLTKAAKYDAAMAKRASGKPVEGTIRPAAPGGKSQPKKTKTPAELAQERVRKSKTSESLADLIYHTELKDMAE